MANQLVEAMKIGEEKARQEMQVAGAYDQYKPDRWEREYTDDLYKQYQERQNPQNPGEPETIQMELPIEFVKQLMIKAEQNPDIVAGLMDDLKIDPTAHKGAQKKTKIYNKATQGSGSEKDWLKKTGPQLPLASIPESYRREGIGNPFDVKMQEYNRDLPDAERIRILNEARLLRA